MIERFNINDLNQSVYRVGRVTQNIIDLLGLKICECDILFARAQIQYTKKHEEEYDDYFDYKTHIEMTPDFITSPLYVGVHPDGQSIRYIGAGTKMILVAIRYKMTGDLWVKSVYPIKEDKIKMYEAAGQLVIVS